MKIPSFIFLLLLVAGSWTASTAQELEYFEIPLKYVDVSLLNNDKCPLQLSAPRVIASKGGDFTYVYKISNDGVASVKSLEIQEFDAFVNPSYGSTPGGDARDVADFPPNESITKIDGVDLKNVPLGQEQIKAFGLSETKKRIWIVLVTKVELYDGTKYDATAKYERIRDFVNKVESSNYDREELGLPPISFDEKSDLLKAFLKDASLNAEIALTNVFANNNSLKR